MRQRVSSTAQRNVAPGARIVTASLATNMDRASIFQEAWLKKRWKRDQCPLPTLELEKMTSVM